MLESPRNRSGTFLEVRAILTAGNPIFLLDFLDELVLPNSLAEKGSTRTTGDRQPYCSKLGCRIWSCHLRNDYHKDIRRRGGWDVPIHMNADGLVGCVTCLHVHVHVHVCCFFCPVSVWCPHTVSFLRVRTSPLSRY